MGKTVGGLEHFFIFPYIGNNNLYWLIFFRGVETTNQDNVSKAMSETTHMDSYGLMVYTPIYGKCGDGLWNSFTNVNPRYGDLLIHQGYQWTIYEVGWFCT